MTDLIKKHIKGYRLISILGPVCKVFEAIFELIVPILVADIIDVGIKSGDKTFIIHKVIIMAALYVVGFLLSVVCQFFAAKAAYGFGSNLRRALYRKINSFSFAEIDKFGTSSLITRLTSDVTSMQTAVNHFIRLITRAPFILIGSVIAAVRINAKISLIFIAAAIAISVVLYAIMRFALPHYKKAQRQLDEIALKTRENLAGARVVRAFGKQREQEEKFSDCAENLNRTLKTVGFINGLNNPLTYLIVNLSIIAVLYFGAKEVNIGSLTQGEVTALVNYLTQIFHVLVVIAMLVTVFTRAFASAKRIEEVFQTEVSLTPGSGAKEDPSAPKLAFDDVSFSYPSDVGSSLSHISFSLNKGQTLGVIGGTGSGKTTLVSLIARFYDATQGGVYIDGANVKDYTAARLKEKVAIVRQHSGLFRGTLRDNIKWGDRNASDEQILWAIDVAQVSDFVSALPEGLDTQVMEGGKNFSGGQRQRLTIARAVVSKADILILDDSSSALDYATDLRLRRALSSLKDVFTTIIVSQRVSSVKSADLIIVLEEGKVVGMGKHDELRSTSKVYNEICISQEGAV